MKAFLPALLLILLALPALAAEKEPVYDRVMRTQTIRCGYGLWDVYLNKDPNTGKMSGIFYDYVETLGKNLSLKIEWVEEVGWGDYITSLVNDRIDAYCTATSWNAERARQVDFITPIFFMGSSIFVKNGDTRFDNNLALLNKEDITLAMVEGDIYSKISNAEFPKAKKQELPQLATPAELFMAVSTGKANAAIMETTSGLAFMEHNPGKLQMVKLDAPFRISPVSISVKGGEFRFQRMLEIATVEMLNDGVIAKILNKYDPKGTNRFEIASPIKVKK